MSLMLFLYFQVFSDLLRVGLEWLPFPDRGELPILCGHSPGSRRSPVTDECSLYNPYPVVESSSSFLLGRVVDDRPVLEAVAL